MDENKAEKKRHMVSGERNGGGRPPRTTLVDGINGEINCMTLTFSTKHIYLKGLDKFFCLQS